MKLTNKKYYKMPDREDNVLIEILNANTEMIDNHIAAIENSLSFKASITSPTFDGEPMAPKPGTIGDNIEYDRIATITCISDALEVEKL